MKTHYNILCYCLFILAAGLRLAAIPLHSAQAKDFSPLVPVADSVTNSTTVDSDKLLSPLAGSSVNATAVDSTVNTTAFDSARLSSATDGISVPDNFTLKKIGGLFIDSVSTSVIGDSLFVRFNIRASNLRIGSMESLTLLPCVVSAGVNIHLPVVVYSGSFRRKFDERTRLYAPNVLPPVYRTFINLQRDHEYTLTYEYPLPYSARLYSVEADARLIVRQRFDDCCNRRIVGEEIYHFAAEGKKADTIRIAPDTLRIVPAPDTLKIKIPDTVYVHKVETLPAPVWRKETLHLAFPVNDYHILPTFGNNTRELSKLDEILRNYPGNIRVIAYASPEGSHQNNDRLARNRAEEFRQYLSAFYNIPRENIAVAHVTEDWDGLRALIAESALPERDEAVNILDNAGDARKQQLMKLRGGLFWKSLSPIFKKLRRIEVEIMELNSNTNEQGKK
jgi:hypothetical protein